MSFPGRTLKRLWDSPVLVIKETHADGTFKSLDS